MTAAPVWARYNQERSAAVRSAVTMWPPVTRSPAYHPAEQARAHDGPPVVTPPADRANRPGGERDRPRSRLLIRHSSGSKCAEGLTDRSRSASDT
jgi:hypothetical protein